MPSQPVDNDRLPKEGTKQALRRNAFSWMMDKAALCQWTSRGGRITSFILLFMLVVCFNKGGCTMLEIGRITCRLMTPSTHPVFVYCMHGFGRIFCAPGAARCKSNDTTMMFSREGDQDTPKED